MKRDLKILFTLLACLSIAEAKEITTPDQKTDGLYLNWIEKEILPQHDFYHYANGSWQKQNPIPPDRSIWSTFSVLQEKNQEAIHKILQQAANNNEAKANSIEQKIGDFYISAMDEAKINQLGATPLQSEFERINKIANLSDLQNEIAHLHLIGVDVFFSFGSMQDFKDSTQMIGGLFQGGLTLPDRDYYLKDDAKFKQIRDALLQHIGKMFVLMGEAPKEASIKANTILDIETKLAKASMSQTEQRDPYAIYHMVNMDELSQQTPGFPWNHYFTALGLSHINQVNLAMPQFMHTMNELMQTIKLEDWKIYLNWHLLNAFSPYLSTAYIDQNFKMSSILTGTKKLLPRWKRVVDTENSLLGFAIGKIYVKEYFSPTAKQEVLHIIHDIRQALHEDLKTIPWMEPATRDAAIKKLAAMEERVGYPDKWWDYSKLMINRGPYVLNVMRASQFLVERDLSKINKPVDRTEWEMSPQTINAYYSPSMNSINLPTGILQPPFFDPNAPAAVNYATIGFIIGHEITHGFDDQGAKFDAKGNLKNWWTKEDLKKFKAATQCIVNQFSQYKVNNLYSVNGNLVVGEATADLGGLTLAYRAFTASNLDKTATTVEGYTPVQQFFLGAAHVWASNIRPEQALNLVTVDPHPPAEFRVNGTLANMPAFQAAFNVPNDSPMVNPLRCVIW